MNILGTGRQGGKWLVNYFFGSHSSLSLGSSVLFLKRAWEIGGANFFLINVVDILSLFITPHNTRDLRSLTRDGTCVFCIKSLSHWTTREVSAAAAAAKSLQSCPTLCDLIDGSPPGSPVPGILQAGTLEWVAISFSSAWKWKVKVKSLSPVQLLATPWTAANQAPPSMGFSRQEYWSGVPSPSPREVPR